MAVQRDGGGAKSILTDHINSCVAQALSIGTLSWRVMNSG
jgi:hypothetical protein